MSTLPFEPAVAEEPMAPEAPSNREKDEELYHKWKSDPSKRNLSNLVQRFQGVIMKKVREQQGSIPNSALEADARSWVVHAIKTYDSSRGASLNTHVNHWVRKVSRINMENQNAARLSESQQLKYNKYNTGLQELNTQLSREPTHAELAGHLNWSIRQVKKMQREIHRDLYDAGEDTAHVASQFDNSYLIHGFIHDNLDADDHKLLHIIADPAHQKKTSTQKADMMGVNLNRFNYLQRKLVDKIGKLKTEMETLHAASNKPRQFTGDH